MVSIRDSIETLVRSFEHMPEGKDPEYLILKGHLLAEEEMLNYLKRAMPNPTPILEGRFSFYNLVKLVEAMRPAGAESWLWKALRDLNSLRNLMAHNLQPKDFNHKAAAFAKFVEQQMHSDWSRMNLDRNTRLRGAIAMLVGSVKFLPRGRKKYPNS